MILKLNYWQDFQVWLNKEVSKSFSPKASVKLDEIETATVSVFWKLTVASSKLRSIYAWKTFEIQVRIARESVICWLGASPLPCSGAAAAVDCGLHGLEE